MLEVNSGVMSIRREAAVGRTDGQVPFPPQPPPAQTEHNPPLSFHLCGAVWDGRTSSLATELGKGCFAQLSPKVTRSIPQLPKKEKFSDRFSIPSPVKGLGPAEFKVSGALGDQAK